MSYPISPLIPIFPGSPLDEFIPHDRMKSGSTCNTTVVHHYTHNATHVDAPFHFYDKGLTIDLVPIEDFCYSNPVIIQKKLSTGEMISVDDVKSAGDVLNAADILLFCTGYYELRADNAEYANDFPSLSKEAAEYIRTQLLNLKAIAIDTLSIESGVLGAKLNNIIHRTLLDGDLYKTRPLLIYEDVNIGVILKKKIERIYAFPLRLVGLDASPVSIVAEIK